MFRGQISGDIFRDIPSDTSHTQNGPLVLLLSMYLLPAVSLGDEGIQVTWDHPLPEDVSQILFLENKV